MYLQWADCLPKCHPLACCTKTIWNLSNFINANLHCWAGTPSCRVWDLYPGSYWVVGWRLEPKPGFSSRAALQRPDLQSPAAPAPSTVSSQLAGSPSTSPASARASDCRSVLTQGGPSPLSTAPSSGWAAEEFDLCTAARLKNTAKNILKRFIKTCEQAKSSISI